MSLDTRVCTTGYLRLPCPLPIASSNKSLQGKYPLAYPLPIQKNAYMTLKLALMGSMELQWTSATNI